MSHLLSSVQQSFGSFLLLICLLAVEKAQPQTDDILRKEWEAFWISAPEIEGNEYGVYLFRKMINLETVPSSFIVNASADNRYKLYVNEQLASIGPAKGDIGHWNYEIIDIAPFLKSGKNIIAAKVWNEAEWKPEAHISLRSGFILQGDNEEEQIINSNSTWKSKEDKSYSPLEVQIPNLYYVAGAGERIDMREHIKDWEKENFDDSEWKAAKQLAPGVPKGVIEPFVSVNNWLLVPSTLPPMEMKKQRLMKVRESAGVKIPENFPSEKVSIVVPPNTAATILLDQSFLTNAYPTLHFSGGKKSGISLGYAESLYAEFPKKGDRDVVMGKTFVGRKDSIISNGSKDQVFTSLNWRTYRYIKLQVKTRDEPLVIEDFYGIFTGYPFKNNTEFQVKEKPEMNQILEIGWRTARLCAFDTYMDTPYYEQLQYIGDARIQGMVSLYNSGDDRLLRNALNHIDNSREPEGLTSSRHPSQSKQFIPPFSLWYIGMLHDYWTYGSDSEFIEKKLPGARQVLEFFRNYQQKDGSLKNVPYWSFTDWVESEGWIAGVAPMGEKGNSAVYDLQLLWAYQLAAEMERELGMKDYASLYEDYALQLKNTIKTKYWDKSRLLFADTPEKDLFSQHANSLAILTGTINDSDARKLGEKLISAEDLAPASIYFKYYLHQALVKAGLGNGYLEWLDIWRENMDMGLSTWAETSDVNNSRSDSHAWGASPNIEFYRTVLGIDSDAPGFSKVRIEPHLGDIKNISGKMPHPDGEISVEYKLMDEGWEIEIFLPSGTSGYLIWKNKKHDLIEGVNEFLMYNKL